MTKHGQITIQIETLRDGLYETFKSNDDRVRIDAYLVWLNSRLDELADCEKPNCCKKCKTPD